MLFSKKQKVMRLIQRRINFIKNLAQLWYYKNFKTAFFLFRGRKYEYFYHKYNTTWKNERAIEVPIILGEIAKYNGKNVLEVGNVLSHYFKVSYDILDKYERGEGVINQDVVDYHPEKKYDLIVSISTLEHVGWDEKPKDPQKIYRGIQNLKNLLKAEGRLIVTLPLGCHPEVDKWVEKPLFSEQYFMKRISKDNRWKEVEANEVKNVKYNKPYDCANGLLIGYYKSNHSAEPWDKLCV